MFSASLVNPYSNQLGGVIYPIMFRYLFSAVGFGWTVRITALMTAVLGVVAILTVKLRHPTNKKARLLPNAKTFKDSRFLLLFTGSFFVCLGVSSCASHAPKTV